MMQGRWVLALGVMTVIAAASVHAAAQSPATKPAAQAAVQTPLFRPCASGELIGTWQLAKIDENPRGYETGIFKMHAPYQFIHFAQDSRYLFARSNMEYKGEKNIAALLNLATGKLGLTFSVDKGVLVIRDAKKITDQHSCNFALKTSGNFEQGELVLSQGRQQPVPTQTTRMYRRILN